jgi:hypothetical protein
MMGAVIGAALLFSGPLSARAGNWELLGEKHVAFVGDRDVIKVGRHEGRFRRIKLVVRDNNIHLDRLVVVYGNGDPDVFETEIKLHRGDSRTFDLKGYARSIRRIELFYRSNLKHLFRGEAYVQVFGDQAGGGRHGDGYDRDDRRHEGRYDQHDKGWRHEGRNHGERQWELLGSQRVGFHIDRDVIHVGHREGRFSAIKLRVHDNSVYFEDLQVVYGNGERDDIQIRHKIRRGDETRALDLRGRGRIIREIRMVYRSQPNFRGKATVEVYGLRE